MCLYKNTLRNAFYNLIIRINFSNSLKSMSSFIQAGEAYVPLKWNIL